MTTKAVTNLPTLTTAAADEVKATLAATVDAGVSAYVLVLLTPKGGEIVMHHTGATNGRQLARALEDAAECISEDTKCTETAAEEAQGLAGEWLDYTTCARRLEGPTNRARRERLFAWVRERMAEENDRSPYATVYRHDLTVHVRELLGWDDYRHDEAHALCDAAGWPS